MTKSIFIGFSAWKNDLDQMDGDIGPKIGKLAKDKNDKKITKSVCYWFFGLEKCFGPYR